MNRPRALSLLLAAAGCHPAARPTTPQPSVGAAAVEAPAPADTELTVRAREAPRMPHCTADDALAVGALAEGIPASPALARRDDGGLVAFVQDHDHDHRADLGFIALDVHGRPTEQGSFTIPDAGEDPSAPALLATDAGYVLAWRRGVGSAQSLATRAFDVHGAPVGPVTALPLRGALGAPALVLHHGAVVLAVARNAAPDADPRAATHLELFENNRPSRTVTAPDGAVFSTDAPVLVSTTDGVRAFAMLSRHDAPAHDERALVRLFDGPDAPPTLLARDMDHPAALATDRGVLLAWRARVARRDSALRAVMLPAQGEITAPPITLATFRGAFETEVALGRLGDDTLAAFSVTTLADDGAGSLNVTLLDATGAALGRAPVLTGFLTRTGHFALSARGDDAWVVLDGRDTDGSGPELLVTHARCDAAHPVERLDVPPATFVQDLTDPDPAPINLPRTPGGGSVALTCSVRGTDTFVRHLNDSLRGSTAAVVHSGPEALLLAISRVDTGAPKLSLARIDAHGHASPTRAIMDDADEILAAEPIGAAASVIVRTTVRDVARADLLSLRGATVAHGLIATGLRDPSSAVLSPDTGVAFVAARTEAGAPMLFRVPTVGGRPGAPTAVAPLRLGDRVVDVMRLGTATEILLARPDPLDPDVGQSIARITLRDGSAARITHDVFTDPVGHPRGEVLFSHHGAAPTPSLVYAERNTLRTGPIEAGQVAHAESLLGTFAGGGSILAGAWSRGERWLALSTGIPDEASGHQNDVRAITLAVLGSDGALRGVNTRIPDDPNAADETVALGVSGRRVTMLYPRVGAQNTIEWAYVDADCGGQP